MQTDNDSQKLHKSKSVCTYLFESSLVTFFQESDTRLRSLASPRTRILTAHRGSGRGNRGFLDTWGQKIFRQANPVQE